MFSTNQQIISANLEKTVSKTTPSPTLLLNENPLTPPEGLETESFYLTTANFDGIEWEPYSATVQMGIDGNDVWLQGISKFLPEAWVKGHIDGGKLVIDLPQYMGDYEEEYSMAYPIFFTAFDESTGLLCPQVTFDYDQGTGSFINVSLPFSVGINKTGYLGLQDFFGAELSPVNKVSGIAVLEADDAGPVQYYDLQGRRLEDVSSARGIVIVKKGDGSVSKVLKR